MKTKCNYQEIQCWSVYLGNTEGNREQEISREAMYEDTKKKASKKIISGDGNGLTNNIY